MNIGDGTKDARWGIMESIFNAQGISAHHLDSFNKFVDQLPHFISGLFPRPFKPGRDNLEGFFSLENIFIDFPRKPDGDLLYPAQCRVSNMTYFSTVYADVTISYKGEDIPSIVSKRVDIGGFPVMIGSNLCNTTKHEDKRLVCESNYSDGGSFVVCGAPYFIVMQESLKNNEIMLHPPSTKNKNLFFCSVECRSQVQELTSPCLIKIYGNFEKSTFNTEIVFHLHKKIPLSLMFKVIYICTYKNGDFELLGDEKFCLELNELFYDMIVKDNTTLRHVRLMARRIVNEDSKIDRKGTLFSCILPKVRDEDVPDRLRNIFTNLVLVHVRDPKNRVFFLAEMTRRMVFYYLGETYKTYPNVPKSDRDSLKNKRLDTSGTLFMELIGDLYRHLADKSQQAGNIRHFLGLSGDILRQMVRAFRTGQWKSGTNSAAYSRTSVVNPYTPTNSLAAVAYLRKITAGQSESRVVAAHQISKFQNGRVCLVETPEDASCGITKNLAVSAVVSAFIKDISDNIKELIIACKNCHESITIGEWISGTQIYYNGALISVISNPMKFVELFIEQRSFGAIDRYVSIVYIPNKNIIDIYSDDGRILRPLFKVTNGKVGALKRAYIRKVMGIRDKKSNMAFFMSLLNEGHIFYQDSSEEQMSYISLYPENANAEHTACEIVHSAVFGVVSGLIPHSDRVPAPRNCYVSSMSKQAIGGEQSNTDTNFPSVEHSIFYPSTPLTRTKLYDITGAGRVPIGQNASLCVAALNGYNQEDSIIGNTGHVDTGFGITTTKSTVSETETGQLATSYTKTASINSLRFGLPPRDYVKRLGSKGFGGLDRRGIIQVGASVSTGTVLYTMISRKGENVSYVVHTYKKNENRVVDKVYFTTNAEGYRVLKIKLRSVRIPIIGSKFSSLHGQKGTASQFMSKENMPFFEDGSSPTILFNPAGIPTRMTINFILEIIGSTYNIEKCDMNASECTAFETFDVKKIIKFFESRGINGFCEKNMYSGTSGKRYTTLFYTGEIYYMRLHHMIEDKISVRSDGSLNSYTRQPNHSGRSHGNENTSGSIGTMETDAIAGHGAAALAKERLMEASDLYVAPVCKKCGQFANGVLCCGETPVNTTMPYGLKLIQQELGACRINMKMNPTPI